MSIKFQEFNINENLKKAIIDLNYITPTPIQEKAIPVMLQGRDLIGQAQTGTGKTAAFAIPMLEKIDTNDQSVQALILCPTRELALQVTEEIKKLYKYLEHVKAVTIYGGQSYDIQIRALKRRPQIIVGTPGRMIDLMNRSLIKLQNINTVILDEADEMLKMGFQEDLMTILDQTPSTRQTVMFSATMPQPIINIANKHLKDFELIKTETKRATVDNIEQSYFIVNSQDKINLFIRLYDFYHFNTSIIFCNTKKDVDNLVVELQSHDYITEGLHGDLKQAQRDRVMNSFRKGNVQILVATDVAARGLDVDDVDAVFNYDLPQEEEIYVHRIGRTGRAGKHGKSFTFITSRQVGKLRNLERFINHPIKQGNIPTITEVKEARMDTVYNFIKENLEKNQSDEINPVIEKLNSEGYSNNQIINVLLGIVKEEKDKEYTSIAKVQEKTRRERDKTTAKRKPRVKSDEVVLFIDAGTKHNIKITKILALLGKHKIRRKDIGKIDINKKGTYVKLNAKDAQKVTHKGSVSISDQEFNTQIIK